MNFGDGIGVAGGMSSDYGPRVITPAKRWKLSIPRDLNGPKLAGIFWVLSLVCWTGCNNGGGGGTSTGLPGGKIPTALKQGPVEEAKAVIAKDADAVRIQDMSGNTALHYAAYTGKLDLVKLLLEAKANPSLTNLMGQTALHRAANAADPEIAKLVLEAGANLNARDIHGRAPISIAIAAGNSDVAKLMMEKKADLTFRNDSGIDPFLQAAGSADVGLVEFFLTKGATVNDQDTDGNSALHHATVSGTVETVKLLVEHKANLGAKNKAGQTPLAVVQSLKGISRGPAHNKIQAYLEEVTPAEFKTKAAEPDIVAFPSTPSTNAEPAAKTDEKDKQ